MERVGDTSKGVVVGSRHHGAKEISSWVPTLIRFSLYPELIMAVKPTTTTKICKIKMNRVQDKIMHNFPYDVQTTAMFIFITLYLVMEIIF